MPLLSRRPAATSDPRAELQSVRPFGRIRLQARLQWIVFVFPIVRDAPGRARKLSQQPGARVAPEDRKAVFVGPHDQGVAIRREKRERMRLLCRAPGLHVLAPSALPPVSEMHPCTPGSWVSSPGPGSRLNSCTVASEPESYWVA